MTEVLPFQLDLNLSSLYDSYRQSRQQSERDSALKKFAETGGRFDPETRRLIAADPSIGIPLAQLAQKYDQRQSALKLSEAFGGQFGGQPQAQPVNSPGIESGPDQRLPRGLRNNNPLNIEAGAFTQSQPGFAGSDGRFARFQTQEQGLGAANALLDTYQNKHGLNTVAGIIGRWAPAGENDTRGYITSVAGRMGVDPNQPLRPEQRQTLIKAMAQFENGRPLPPGASAVAPVGGAPTTSSPPQAATPWPAAPQNGNPTAPQATLGGKSMDQWLPMMMKIATHPDAPPEVQKVAIEFVKGAQAEAGLTKEQKEYRGYVQQGGKDDFTTWDRKNRTASATLINTAEGLEGAQMKARIDVDKAAIGEHAKKVIAGRSALPILDQIVSIANKTPGGWAGAASPTLAKAISGLGIPVPEGISNAELMISLNRQLVPGVRDPGAASNLEQNMYMQALPALSQSPEARLKIAGMMRSMLERNAEILKVYRANLGSPDLDKKLSELDNKPLFAPEDRKLIERFAGGGVGTANAAGGQISEGATATNKATNEKIVFKGGQWVPAQ